MARDPGNLKRIIPVSGERRGTIDVSNIPEFDIANWDLNNEAEFKRYMKWTESIIRGSYEYRRFISYLKNYSDIDHCSILTRISNRDSSHINIELHHEPLTLYDILLTVLYKRSDMREDLDEYMVAKEVLYWHYQGCVGLVPLCELVHELVHNQFIFIPSNIVLGRWKTFVELYHKYIPEETLATLDKIEELSKSYDLNVVREILDPYIIEINDPNRSNLAEVFTYIKGKLDEYNSNLGVG